MTTVVRDIQTSGDFVRVYGRRLTRDPDLKIDEVLPGEGMTVLLKTAQAPVGVAALNGFVTVNAGKGPVQLMVVAYAARPQSRVSKARRPVSATAASTPGMSPSRR